MLNEVLILLFLSVLSVAIFKRIDFPGVLGYLVVGLLAGDHAFGWAAGLDAVNPRPGGAVPWLKSATFWSWSIILSRHPTPSGHSSLAVTS